MAKKNFDIDSLFDTPATKATEKEPVQQHVLEEPAVPPRIEEPTVPPRIEEPTVPTATREPQKKKASNKASKLFAEGSPKVKHTFPIPADVWADFEILLFALQQQGQKKTQNGLITELMQKAIEENIELINRFKMSGVK